MAYPGSIYSPRTRANWPGAVYNVAKTTIFFKEDCDAIEGEIVAIEDELGTNPKGSDADVKTRLNRMDATVVFPSSAPGTAQVGSAYFNSTLNKLYIYNGLGWVSVQLL